jgi:hypothetical protein
MSIPRITPVFTISAKGSVEEVCAQLHTLVRDDTGPYTGNVAGQHMTLTVREDDRHFWSPWLHIEVTDHDGQTHIRGRFTPHPNIWTSLAFSYFTLLSLAVFAGVWGMSQWMLEQHPTAMWIALACVVVVGLLWWSAQVGQRLAREQMHVLRDAVEGVM